MTASQGGMLIAAPERWDEACFAVPAVRAMVASGLGIGILCPSAQAEFWSTVSGVVVVGFPERAKPKVVADALAGNWQASLAWESNPAAEAFKIAGISRRLGPGDRKLSKLLTHPLSFAPGPLEHRVRYYLAAVEELGVTTGRAEYFFPADLGIEPALDAVLLCPGSDFGPSHEWPVERWEEIARAISESGGRVTIASVEGGRGLAKILADRLDGAAEFFHATPLAGVLPLLAVHGLVVAADGSLPHLAAHAGATCITLFGPNDPLWKRPLGRRHSVMKRHVECSPCLLPKCPMDMRCQRELEVERVITTVREKLGFSSPGNLPVSSQSVQPLP